MKKAIIAALAVVAMVGCTKEEEQGVVSEAISPEFASSIVTRVAETSWESGDQIGIMVINDNELSASYSYNNCYNVSFGSNAEQGTFTAASYYDRIYYSLNSSNKIDFYAYYPYNSELLQAEESYPIDITDQSAPNKLDFMEASTRATSNGGYNQYSGTVNLDFSRNMSKVTLNLVCSDGITAANITGVELSGFYTTATYDFVNNAFVDLGGRYELVGDQDSGDYVMDIVITPYKSSDTQYSAILIPEDDEDTTLPGSDGGGGNISMATRVVGMTGRKITFTTDKYGDKVLYLDPSFDYPDDEYDVDGYDLTKGKHWNLTVNLTPTEVSFIGNEIAEWGDASIEAKDLDAVSFTGGSAYADGTAPNGDWEIGIFMDATEQTNDKSNIKYISDGVGDFEVATLSEMIHYPTDDTGVTFYAYSPYQDNATTIYSADVATDQSDFMVTGEVAAKSGHAAQELEFDHKLSKMTLNISDFDEVLDFSSATVSISGVHTQGSYNVKTGALNGSLSESGTVSFTMDNTAATATATAILLPETLDADDATITIKAKESSEEKTYTLKLTATTFEAGKNHTYNIVLGDDEPAFVSSSISNWSEVTSGTPLHPTLTED